MSEQCTWYGTDPLYVAHHDSEWGVPCYDGRALWEQLVLEGFQAGLSWITILRKREGFRNAFAGFDPSVVSTWDDGEVTRLLTDARIIRHRGKIEATITNAQAYLRIEQDVGFSKFIWDYVDGTPIQNRFDSFSQVPSQTPLSAQISKDLKKLGFRFCGPTTVYAFMQASGLVNDHLTGCPRFRELGG